MLGVVGTVLGCLGLYSWMAEDFEDEDDRQVGIARLMLQTSEFLVTWLGAVPCLQITLLATEGTAGRDGSDQHGPDDFLLECRHTKLVTFLHRSQNTAASLATHASASIAFDAEGQVEASTSTRATTFWLIFSSCLNCLDIAFGDEVQLCKQQTEQRWSRQLKSSAVRAVRSISSSPWPSWQKPVGDASGRPVKACLLWWWRALRPSQWWRTSERQSSELAWTGSHLAACRLVSSRGPEGSGTSFHRVSYKIIQDANVVTILTWKEGNVLFGGISKVSTWQRPREPSNFQALQLVGRDEQAEHGWVEINGPLALEVAHVHLHLRSQSCLAEQFWVRVMTFLDSVRHQPQTWSGFQQSWLRRCPSRGWAAGQMLQFAQRLTHGSGEMKTPGAMNPARLKWSRKDYFKNKQYWQLTCIDPYLGRRLNLRNVFFETDHLWALGCLLKDRRFGRPPPEQSLPFGDVVVDLTLLGIERNLDEMMGFILG